MSGSLYQLWRHQFTILKYPYVRIDGPWDTYGILLSGERPEHENTYLIRGIGKTAPWEIRNDIRDKVKR